MTCSFIRGAWFLNRVLAGLGPRPSRNNYARRPEHFRARGGALTHA